MSAKPWAEPGLTIEERAARLEREHNLQGVQGLATGFVAEALRQVRAEALEEAAAALEGAHFLFAIGTPGEGPFTRQDRTMREVVEQGAVAIRSLKAAP